MFTWLRKFFTPDSPLSITPVRVRAEAHPGWTHNLPFGYFSTLSGIAVSEEQAMRASAVLACIRILCEDLASLPLCVSRKAASGWVETPNHPVTQLLGRVGPNPYMTSMELREHMIMDCLLHGHFANWVMRDGAGNVTGIFPLRANLLSRISPVTIPEPALRSGSQPVNYMYGGVEYAQKNQFTSWELWRGTILPDSYILDPYLQRHAITILAREAIGLAIAAEGQGARLFSQGMQTRLAVTAQGDLDKDQREDLRKSFDPNSGFFNAWRPLVLENGVTVSDIGITPEESQFLETRQFQLADIARAFRVPMIKLGSLENVSTYGAAEQQSIEYVKSCVLPWTRRIEETGQRDLFREDEANLYLRHDLNHLLRADAQTRWRCYQIAVQSGILNRNECRIAEGYDKADGLDVYLTPSTALPVAVDEPDAPPVRTPVRPNGHAKPV